ncbi:sodium/hydrogen exchanger 1-like [Sinocyclocheilus rhinocerous]|uniref:sodium/hydrogen exchanger 1-like n=1 Tax=Sinocyclocheilus rhinocerous TaxID=307959 RepID=UPI0007BAC361|nr:PREDICTED: sodium/hydrogen exchanger 1-like [Sinocyclocheilus rhinocerous]
MNEHRPPPQRRPVSAVLMEDLPDRFPPTDPQAWGLKSVTESIPTIKVDLASPQSPESVNVVDEFSKKGSQPKEEEGGLTMKVPSPAKQRKDKTPDEEPQQRLMRCLSDPGPAAEEEDEDEPFLP